MRLPWTLLLCLPLVSADCPAQSRPLTVGLQTVVLPVPALSEGRNFRRTCEWVNPGYEGFVEAICVGSRLSVGAGRCSPKGCAAGLVAEVEVGDQLVEATNARSLLHGEVSSVTCSSLVEGFHGYVWLRCSLGELEGDASSCQPRAVGERSFWRIVNADYLPGTWRVYELAFHVNKDCSGELQGTIVSSSQQSLADASKQLAFDRNAGTSWAARCDGGCEPGVAWLGLVLDAPSERVRCVNLLQSRVACCGSRNVRLEVWDGAGWQAVQVWDTAGLERGSRGFALPVPATCEAAGGPEGAGVEHDCRGPPVVGLQAGDTCHAECGEGYYGSREKFTCGPNGLLVGQNPTCYHEDSIYRFGGAVCALLGLLFLACQYRFWCMYHKVQLTHDIGMILPAMTGRWFEKEGTTVWQVILDAEHEDDRKSAYDFDEGGGEAAAGAGATEKGKGAADGAAKAGRGDKDKDGEPQFIGKGTLKADLEMARKGMITETADEEVEFVLEKKKVKTYSTDRYKSRTRVFLDGLCSPCEDPDLCCTCVLCPLCRVADTWHTIGVPTWLTFWRTFFLYAMCPCMWPCLNFYGRLRVRKAFDIPLEPHRDFCVHCCCCLCCAPCAICQEARTVDAPVLYHRMVQRVRELKDEGSLA